MHGRTRRTTTYVALLGIAVGVGLGTPAIALTGSEGVAALNAQRTLNGIPGDLTEAADLSEGCRKHKSDYVEKRGQYPHTEIAGQPGYSADGRRAAASSDLSSVTEWSRIENPWTGAPLHLALLFDPNATVTWYGEGKFGSCMGTSGQRFPARDAFFNPPAPSFFGYPGPGTSWVPFETQTAEWPFTPAEVLGIDEPAGPTLIVWATGLEAPQILSVALAEAGGGSVEVRWADSTTTSSPGNKLAPAGASLRGFGDPGYVIPPKALKPKQQYVLSVDWKDNASGAGPFHQTVQFSTIGRDPGTYVESQRVGYVLHTRTKPAVEATLTDRVSGRVIRHSGLHDGDAFAFPAAGGNFRLCLKQAPSGVYEGADGCRNVTLAGARLGKARVEGSTLIVPVLTSLTAPAEIKYIIHRAAPKWRAQRLTTIWPSIIRETTFDKLHALRIPIKSRKKLFVADVFVRVNSVPLGDGMFEAFDLGGTFTLRAGSSRPTFKPLR